MKIAYLINELDICGGTHKQLLKLLQYTNSLGLEFCVITKRLDYNKTYKGFRDYSDFIYTMPKRKLYVRILNKLGFRNFALSCDFKTLKSLVKDYDIVNIHDYGFEFLLPSLSDKKVVWQVNDLPNFFAVGAHKDRILTKKEKELKEKVCENSKVVNSFTVNVSKNAERINEAFGRDSHVFYCGVDPILIERSIESSLTRFKNKEINLLTSGVFFPYRNYETQVKVVKILKERGWKVKLNIIGNTKDVHYAQTIRDLIRINTLEQEINICGQVDNETFEKLHSNSDMFLFINVDQSWGLAVFEAMSCKMPVIVSNSVGAVEILNDKIDSFFVNPLDEIEIVNKIEGLAESPDNYCNISENAGKFHNNWTWDKAYSSKMIELFKSIDKKG